jgi:hypothetical protein
MMHNRCQYIDYDYTFIIKLYRDINIDNTFYMSHQILKKNNSSRKRLKVIFWAEKGYIDGPWPSSTIDVCDI